VTGAYRTTPVTVLVVYLSVRHARPHLSLAVSVVAAAVTTVLAVVLIPRHGIAGAAVASAVGYAVGGALAWLFFRRVARTAR
jgi:O-antigen/teichoic acid export membrane protein